jgi:hypothetical protein
MVKRACHCVRTCTQLNCAQRDYSSLIAACKISQHVFTSTSTRSVPYLPHDLDSQPLCDCNSDQARVRPSSLESALQTQQCLRKKKGGKSGVERMAREGTRTPRLPYKKSERLFGVRCGFGGGVSAASNAALLVFKYLWSDQLGDF